MAGSGIAGPGLGPDSSQVMGLTNLFHQGQRINQAIRPLREEDISQMLEALRTGGIQARIPVVQQAVSQSMQATSQARQQSEDQLAKYNLLGTPYGQNILQQLLRAGAQQTAAIPTNMAMQFIGQAPSAINNIGNQGLNALQNAASLDLQRREFNAKQYQALMEDIKQSMMFTGSAAAGMGGGGGTGGEGTASPSTVNVPQYSGGSANYGGASFNPQYASSGGGY